MGIFSYVANFDFRGSSSFLVYGQTHQLYQHNFFNSSRCHDCMPTMYLAGGVQAEADRVHVAFPIDA
jgi:hypothetical protein